MQSLKNLIAFSLAGTFAACAGLAEEVSPDMVVEEALRHSNYTKMAGEDVAAAEAVKKQADAAVYPSLDLDATAAHYEGLKENSFPNFIIPAIPERYGGGITLSQPLYTGGRISGRRSVADEHRQASRSSLAASRADVIYQALTAYWSWSKAFYAAESYRAAVSWMEAHDRDMRNQRVAGLVTENDQLSTAVRLDQTRLRLEQALRHDSLCRAALEKLTGNPLASGAAPARPPSEDLQAAADEQALIGGALTNRPDVQARKYMLNAEQKNIDVQRSGYFPQLNARLRGEAGRPNPLNIPPNTEWLVDAYVGVGVTWNLLDWGLTRAKVSEARARANRAGYQLAELNERVVFEVRQALINLNNALTRVRVARRAEESARLDLKSATDLWQNGLARHSDVLDSQARLTDAGFDLVSAAADVALARAELDHAYGVAEIKEMEAQSGKDGSK